VELPFPFPLFESNYTNVSILDNGALYFGDHGSALVSKADMARAEPFRGHFFAGLNAAAQFGGRRAVDFCNN
jgi:hypothetical protein